MSEYTPTIGLEIHAELKTKTKMFCGSLNDPHHAEPNTHVCPVCLAHPGTLPVINKEAVKHVLKVGLAVNGSLATFTEFDRKNYFYPDIPKGYQISQYKYPLVAGGALAGIALMRVHLEEDTARSQHDQGEKSFIDYNRAGVPLMELVTEPVMHDAETAVRFARELQLLLRTLGVSDANMEQGEMRVEANISISKDATLGTKVEVKNLNSFKAVESAINFEIRRQMGILEQEGGMVVQETRGWDEQKSLTFSQRLKETSEDYRYFPDPDLPKLDISQIDDLSATHLSSEMPELPEDKRSKYSNLGLPREQIEVIVNDLALSRFYDRLLQDGALASERAQLAANYLTSDAQALLTTDSNRNLADANPVLFKNLIGLVAEGKITSRVAKDLLPEVLFEGVAPEKIVAERGLAQENSKEALTGMVHEVLRANPAVVAEYKGGKETSIQFLIGQTMKVSKGAANPAVLKSLLEEELSK